MGTELLRREPVPEKGELMQESDEQTRTTSIGQTSGLHFRSGRLRRAGLCLHIGRVLLTPFPRGRDLSERDSAEIRKIIHRLKGDARRDPDWDEVSVWRNGKKPPDAVEGSFSDALMRARAKGCIFLAVWDDDFFRIDETYLVESMARDEPTGRPN